ncbi:divalent-cation tolerance protein CutA [Spongiactinospora sp. 9N601]|uniref:divalent-cation tolerance protein CutA n=1 Tax=Spongiactinospora sp. 9N601 TaxID=3375149 RepID=UPI003787CB75
MTDFVQVSTTTAGRDAALALLRSAVESKLAASGQVFGPAISVFWHQGELGEAEEWQVVLKSTRESYPALEAHLVERHPWDNPEVTFTSIDGGSTTYLEWLRRTTV